MSDSHEIERMVKELLEAGWIRKGVSYWLDPNGLQYMGPAGAHREMCKRALETGSLSEQWRKEAAEVRAKNFVDPISRGVCLGKEDCADALDAWLAERKAEIVARLRAQYTGLEKCDHLWEEAAKIVEEGL